MGRPKKRATKVIRVPVGCLDLVRELVREWDEKEGFGPSVCQDRYVVVTATSLEEEIEWEEV